MARMARVPAVGGEQAERDDEQDGGRRRVDMVLAEHLEHPPDERRPAAEQRQPDDVSGSRLVAVVVRHVTVDQPLGNRPTGTLTKKMTRHGNRGRSVADCRAEQGRIDAG